MCVLPFSFVQSSACCIFAKLNDELYVLFTPREREALQALALRDMLWVFKLNFLNKIVNKMIYGILDFFYIIFHLLSFSLLKKSMSSLQSFKFI